MAGVNKCIIVGNLGQDPESRFLPSGKAVANISIATSESWTDRQSGQKQEKTEWHRCVAFDKTAEIIQQYLRKGSKVYVEGKLQTRKWQDQQGNDKYATEIIISTMQMLDSKQGGGQQRPQGNYQQPAHQQNTYPDSFDDGSRIPF